MNTNEIKAIIAEKIAGQGNQVDIGGALAEILNAIVDNSGGVAFVLNVNRDYNELSGEYDTKNELLQALGIDSESWDKFISTDSAIIKFYSTYKVGEEEVNAIDVFSVASKGVHEGSNGSSTFNVMLGVQVAQETGTVIQIQGGIENGEEKYSISVYEV